MSIITQENQELLQARIDSLIKLNGFWEMIDGTAIGIIIKGLDDYLLSKLDPIKYQDDINDVVEKFIQEDYVGAAEELGDILATAINTPKVDATPEENEMYRAGLRTMALFLINMLKGNPQPPEEK